MHVADCSLLGLVENYTEGFSGAFDRLKRLAYTPRLWAAIFVNKRQPHTLDLAAEGIP